MMHLLLAPVFAVFRRAPVKTPQEKLNEIFQVRNRIRNLNTGREYTVFEVDFGGALLVADSGQVLKTDWISGTGRLRADVIAKWELVEAVAVH